MNDLAMDKDLLERKRQWREYVKHNTISDQTRPVVLEAWRRCQAMGINPYQRKPKRMLDERQMCQLRKENGTLLEISAPIVQNLINFISGSGFVVTLTNQEGVILKILGDEDVKNSISEGGFVEGADWSESSAGSNAIGTALATQTPLQLSAYEHFCILAQVSTCSSAPIKDPEGNMIGVIDLSAKYANVNNHTLGMAVAAANAIENCLRIYKEEQKNHLENAYKNAIIESVAEGVIATDPSGNITLINKAAMSLLQFTDGTLGRNIQEVLPAANEKLFSAFLSGKRCTDEEINVSTDKGYMRVLATARPIVNNVGGNKGIVVVISELQRAKRIAHKMSDTSAKLTFSHLLGKNKAFQETVKTARLVASSNSTILLLGESGTGKDVFAQAIHNESRRRDGPFVAINCGAIPKELIASELFGYIEGAFTGAKRGGNPGKFELADGGAIFLDEIGEMPLELQVNLLRVLEQKSICRIGGSEVIPIDVRIIAATNRDLKEAVARGYFREDLYYRLNVLALKMVPLRERRDDIPILIEHFYKQFHGDTSGMACVVPEEYIKILQSYHWPGNIRELQNIIERSVNLSSTGILEIASLPEDLKSPPRCSYSKFSIPTMEKDLLEELMVIYRGNITKISNELGIARTTLYRKLMKYRINKDMYV